MLLGEAVWDLVPPHQPDTHDLKVGLFPKHSMPGKADLVNVFCSRQEAVHQVVGDMQLFTFSGILVVVEEPERPACPVEHLVPLVDGGSLLVSVVDEESLEVVQVEVSRGQRFHVVFFLLFFFGWLWSCGSCWFIGFFHLFNWVWQADGLHWFLNESYCAVELLELWHAEEFLCPV
jgi:hypothetical protein